MFTPWLVNKKQAEFVYDKVNMKEIKSTVVALQFYHKGKEPQLPVQLKSFPTGYRYCGDATYPYRQQKIKIWQSLEEL